MKMICAGFHTSMTLFIISDVDREEMNYFFSDLIRFLYINGYVEHKLISSRLYRRYVKIDDVEKIYNLIKLVEVPFLKKNNPPLYLRYINGFYKACEEILELKKMNIFNGNQLRISLNIPYGVYERMLPDKFYDDLPGNAEPFWLRNISMKEYTLKYSNDIDIINIVNKW